MIAGQIKYDKSTRGGRKHQKRNGTDFDNREHFHEEHSFELKRACFRVCPDIDRHKPLFLIPFH